MNAYILLKYDDQFLNLPAIFATIQIRVSGWVAPPVVDNDHFRVEYRKPLLKGINWARSPLFVGAYSQIISISCESNGQTVHVFHKRGGVVEISQTLQIGLNGCTCFCLQLLALATLSLVCVDMYTIRTLTLNGPTIQDLRTVHILDQKATTPLNQVMRQLSCL